MIRLRLPPTPAAWAGPVWGVPAALLFVLVAVREIMASADLAGPLWAHVLTSAGMATPLVAGRRFPAMSVIAAVAGAVAQTTWLTPSTHLAMPLLGVLVAAFTAARHTPGRRGALALLALCLAGEWAGPVAVNQDPLGDGLFVSVALWAVWLLGRSGRARERFAREEEARIRAEREREARVQAAVTAERQAVARDLHDTVAHAVTLMVLQATGTRLIARERPEAAQAALGSIEQAGRRAMEDLRAMLHVLREDGPGGAPAAPLAPGPGLDLLPGLVQGACDSGLEVTLDLAPAATDLPPALAATAYRTVQEGLTNAARHAPGSQVHVTVRATTHLVTTTVDNGPPSRPAPAPTHGTGTGLIGLGERVTALGGHRSARPRPDGGFTLTTELPRKTP
ncbi:sensor histidine kinase [Streptomyces sp. NPDC015131]|uniref:sensor histidine kinase n=1 Tax=Streptomyces sp. NPDC015131 TaxID=3364941 RepID=UPI00370214A0